MRSHIDRLDPVHVPASLISPQQYPCLQETSSEVARREHERGQGGQGSVAPMQGADAGYRCRVPMQGADAGGRKKACTLGVALHPILERESLRRGYTGLFIQAPNVSDCETSSLNGSPNVRAKWSASVRNGSVLMRLAMRDAA